MDIPQYRKPSMPNQAPFEGPGFFLKGNLHTHTSLTDGALGPQEVVDIYRRAGYDFIALSEHFLYVRGDQYAQNGMLVMPAIEVNFDDPANYHYDHILGILVEPDKGGYPDMARVVPYPRYSGAGVQQIIDELHARGHFVIYAHPRWSRRDVSQILHYQHLDALEIYNHSAEHNVCAGYADQYWDAFLRRNRRLYCTAADDAHHFNDDRLGGWVCVKATERSRQGIAQALRSGRFYASNGPEIHDIRVQDGVFSVRCSEAREIHLITYEYWGRNIKAAPGAYITSAEMPLRGDELYARAEVIDHAGRKAWSQPLYLY
nr:CehA/McbA family metallohydrolase [Maliibacterium massiliense]